MKYCINLKSIDFNSLTTLTTVGQNLMYANSEDITVVVNNLSTTVKKKIKKI